MGLECFIQDSVYALNQELTCDIMQPIVRKHESRTKVKAELVPLTSIHASLDIIGLEVLVPIKRTHVHKRMSKISTGL